MKILRILKIKVFIKLSMNNLDSKEDKYKEL